MDTNIAVTNMNLPNIIPDFTGILWLVIEAILKLGNANLMHVSGTSD